MKPIRKGDRGPAVEDVQRRLLVLGADLGASGIDGVFLGATFAAVQAFQTERGLAEDGVVGPETWSVLVDATFRLGDRLLYLRFPHLHGADVVALQGALNALGFQCGRPDGIFGAFTERAVREFQANTGLPVDGIAGPDTARALENLRHVWQGKVPEAPDELRAQVARSADLLAGRGVSLSAADEAGRAIAERVANLARAACADARVAVVRKGMGPDDELTMVLGSGLKDSVAPRVVVEGDAEAVARRVAAAVASADRMPARVEIGLPELPQDDGELQRIAVAVLDGICLGLAASSGTVVT